MIAVVARTPYGVRDREEFSLGLLVGMPVGKNVVVKIGAVIAPSASIESDARICRVHNAVAANPVSALRCNLVHDKCSPQKSECSLAPVGDKSWLLTLAFAGVKTIAKCFIGYTPFAVKQPVGRRTMRAFLGDLQVRRMRPARCQRPTCALAANCDLAAVAQGEACADRQSPWQLRGLLVNQCTASAPRIAEGDYIADFTQARPEQLR